MIKAAVIFTIVLFAIDAGAQTPRERLVGIWKLSKIRGSTCGPLVGDLEYYFGSDGRYEVTAIMNRFGGKSEEKAKGTYVADDRKATAMVDGQKVGPYLYRFEGGTLVIHQSPPGCDYFLDRED